MEKFKTSVYHRMTSFPKLVSKAPRFHLFSRVSAPRLFSSTVRHQASDNERNPLGSFQSPSPPRLPKEEQEIFETLQRQSTGAFSTPRAPPKINQSPDSSADEIRQADAATEERKTNIEHGREADLDTFKREIEARGSGEELHPNVRRGADPEFQGETNPKTGEVGGPKNEPLRWGADGEWSYNGRTTDF
ncbi:MAG: hypothetical protein Q9227_000948 [Pyrenula ochraceoflavens]